jgi:hypothetical protein
MTRLRSRRFEARDEAGVNDLFNRTVFRLWTGKAPRSLQLLRWLWYHAPGGPVDSWIVEAEHGDGSWRIAGHHALCPMRFTLGGEDLLCAKTANSILLPEYRSKFLYLRFEKECLDEAGDRFDATYSLAPGTTRLRKALGYQGAGTGVRMVRGLQACDSLSRLFGHFANRYPRRTWGALARVMAAVSEPEQRSVRLKLQEYTPEEAMQSPFFSQFWQEARLSAGMSARRDLPDLAWRFWKRPDSTYATLIHEGECGSRGYCIVNTTNPCSFHLEDIFFFPPRTDALDAFLTSLFQWSARRGALLLLFSTTTDGQPSGFLDVFARRMRPHPLQHFRPPHELPRRFSSGVRAKFGAGISRWNATALLAPV